MILSQNTPVLAGSIIAAKDCCYDAWAKLSPAFLRIIPSAVVRLSSKLSRSTERDAEILLVAKTAKELKTPVIVAGDLNDVAWSHTTELFRKTSELLDPRRGRGFYSTFSAHHWYIRFPLDYIFCSKEFGLIEMKRMPKNGSDHFATLTHLAFREDLKRKQDPAKADQDELEEASQLAAQPVKE